MEKKYVLAGFDFSSTSNPEKLSRSVKSLAVLVPSLVVLARLVGWDAITEVDLNSILDSVASAIVAVFAAISALTTVYYGLIRIYKKLVG